METHSQSKGHALHIGLTLLTIILLVLATILAAQAVAQEGKSLVYIEQLKGVIDGSVGNYRITITGEVVNSLPFDIVDVRVGFYFPEDNESPFLDTTIDHVGAGKSSPIRVTKNSTIILTSYTSGVLGFVALSDQADELIDYFWRTDDPVLQTAIVKGFSRMGEGAVPSLLECIGTAGRESIDAIDVAVADLMCLDALTAIGDPRAVDPLLDLLAWYIDTNGEAFELVLAAVSDNPDTPLAELAALSPEADTGLSDLIVDALVSTGNKGIPALLRASGFRRSHIAQQAASQALAAMDKTNVAALLNEPDQAVLEDIVIVLGELGRADAVIPMLELVDLGVLAPDAVEPSILAMEEAAVSALSQALRHQHGSVANHAESLLRQIDPEFTPRLEEEVEKATGAVPTEAWTIDKLVDALVASAQAELNAQIDLIFERGWEAYSTGDCSIAVQEMGKMFEVRDDTNRHADQVAIVYHCHSQALIASGKAEEAVPYLRQAQALDPEDLSIQSNLAIALLQRSKNKRATGNWDEVLQDLREVLALDPSNVEAQQLFWATMVRANRVYFLAGVVGLVVLTFALRADPHI